MKLIVLEKPGRFHVIKPILDKRFSEYVTDYYGIIISVLSDSLVYQHNGDWYLRGEKTNMTQLILSDFMPNGYLVEKTEVDPFLARNFKSGKFSNVRLDEIVFLLEGSLEMGYFDAILSAKRYLDVTGYPERKAKCIFINIGDGDYYNMSDNTYAFSDIYSHAKDKIAQQMAENVQNNEFAHVLQSSNMTLSKFCSYFKIPRSTAENWKYGKAQCPAYLLELLQYKLKNEGLEV